MDRADLPPLVGIAGCLAVVLALAYPYVASEGAGVGLYYGSGAVNPLVAGLFAIVTVIVIAAGREERTDPVLAAGITLVSGLFVVLVAGLWATTMRLDVLTVWPDHRWALVVTGLALPVSGLWWARELGVF